MSTLLLCLSGPMQSWGVDSRFDVRFTGREPSKSGVLGLVCAALGKPREEQPGDGHPTLAALAALRLGVRLDRPGVVRVDYQTAQNVAKAAGGIAPTVQSWRYYLADAMFLCGLEGDDALVRRVDAALAAPVWGLSLGRKSYVPGEPVRLPDAGPDGRYWGMPLEEALGAYPRLDEGRRRQAERLLMVVERRPGELPPAGERDARRDVPLDFARRRFGVRFVSTLPVAEPVKVSG